MTTNNANRIIEANKRGYMATITPAQVVVPKEWIKTGHSPTSDDQLGCGVYLGDYHYRQGGFYRNFRAALYDNGDYFIGLSIFAIPKTLRDFTTSWTYRYDWQRIEFAGMSGMCRFAITKAWRCRHTKFFDTTLRLMSGNGEPNACIEEIGLDEYEMTAKDLLQPWRGSYIGMLQKVSER